MIHVWRLSEAGPDNLGLACTDEGLVLGQTLLVERREGRFVVRARAEIERLLKRAYQMDIAMDRLMSGLATVAAALNANDQCLARIAAVHLKIPDLRNIDARYALEVEDAVIKLAFGQSGAPAPENATGKASPDDPKHPGWPKGTPDRKGGQFRPKTDAEIAPEVAARLIRITARRGLRIVALKLLRLVPEAAANVVPFLDVVADAALVLDVTDAVSQFWKLATDVTAALDFARRGPHSLESCKSRPAATRSFPGTGTSSKAN
jgi:acetolactate synthase regulatory subunit